MSIDHNTEAVRRYWEGRFNQRDYSVVDELLSPSADPDGQRPGLMNTTLRAVTLVYGSTS